MKKTTLLVIVILLFAQNLTAQRRSYDEKTQKRGIDDYEGMPLIPAAYDDVWPYFFDNDTLYVAKNGDRKGIFDKNGRLTVPFDYQELEIWAAQSHFQFGYALVKKERRANSGWGMVDAHTGKQILPHKFEFVRAIFRDLLVGRQFADSTLQFFNGRGEPLFQLFGRSAAPGFDENSIQIRRVDRSEYFADKTGKPIFPPNLKNPIWTDGERVICSENGKWGITTISGKVLVPFDWSEIKAQNPGQFLVKNAANERGLMDAKGQFIIPLSRGNLYLPGGKPGPLYIRSELGNDPNFNFQIFDAAGKLLFSDVRISTMASSDMSRSALDRRNEYYTAEVKGKKEQFVFHYSRGQILPTAWASVVYGGEKHPLIVSRKDETGRAVDFQAIDLNGQLLFAAPAGVGLVHTRNPRLLLAGNNADNSSSLIYLDSPSGTTVFENNSIVAMYNGYFQFRENNTVGLLDPNGKVLVPAGNFISLGDPNTIQIKEFRENKTAHGKLVAVGYNESVRYPAWVGVNERGEAFDFGPPVPPVEIPKVVEPVEAMESEVMEEVDVSKMEVPVLEEMPAETGRRQ